VAALKADHGQFPFAHLRSCVRIRKLSSSHAVSPHVALRAEDDRLWLKYAAGINTAENTVVLTPVYSFCLAFT
jgi:hypothetical protein